MECNRPPPATPSKETETLPDQQQPTGFFTLPQELRDKIYEYYFSDPYAKDADENDVDENDAVEDHASKNEADEDDADEDDADEDNANPFSTDDYSAEEYSTDEDSAGEGETDANEDMIDLIRVCQAPEVLPSSNIALMCKQLRHETLQLYRTAWTKFWNDHYFFINIDMHDGVEPVHDVIGRLIMTLDGVHLPAISQLSFMLHWASLNSHSTPGRPIEIVAQCSPDGGLEWFRGRKKASETGDDTIVDVFIEVLSDMSLRDDHMSHLDAAWCLKRFKQGTLSAISYMETGDIE